MNRLIRLDNNEMKYIQFIVKNNIIPGVIDKLTVQRDEGLLALKEVAGLV